MTDRRKLGQVSGVVMRQLTHLPSRLILEKTNWVGLVILGLGLLLSAAIVSQIFLTSPETPREVAAPERRLDVSVIDRLELWIEEVEAERAVGMRLPARSVFVVDDPVKVETGD